MARVAVGHKGLTNPDAKKPPVREPVPEGNYVCTIMNCVHGATSRPPVLSKLTVEFQILYGVSEDEPHDKTHSGRRVFQDYILDHDDRYPDLSETRRYELVQLLDSCDVEYDDDGFDDDHLKNKSVKITVRHRKSREPDEDGNHRVFTNVVRVDEVAGDDDEGDVL